MTPWLKLFRLRSPSTKVPSRRSVPGFPGTASTPIVPAMSWCSLSERPVKLLKPTRLEPAPAKADTLTPLARGTRALMPREPKKESRCFWSPKVVWPSSTNPRPFSARSV